jgi:isopenicillin N synthase-like dioxygenase
MSTLTNGYVKSSVHAVSRPFPDQQGLIRYSLLYFLRPVDDAKIVPLPSPVLKRLGYVKEEDLTPTKETIRATGESTECIEMN